jgi:nucleoside-diphosphate-sugar epimerase
VRALITGVAGFIGSTLADALLEAGHELVGIDSLTGSYDPCRKRANISKAQHHPSFTFVEADLAVTDLAPVLDGVDTVFHMAALSGNRDSWGADFAAYERANVLVTQRLLESCRGLPLGRLVYSSSSSIYGAAARFPVVESDLPRPATPYGVTKLAGEHLCRLYADNFGVPVVALRYFSVYGPRQRPDMAMHRIIEAAISGAAFPVLGDGSQRRDFTYVGDAVDAIVRAVHADAEPGIAINIGTGTSTSLNTVIDMVGNLLGRRVPCNDESGVPGDPKQTEADVSLARDVLGWTPQTALAVGLGAQIESDAAAFRAAR